LHRLPRVAQINSRDELEAIHGQTKYRFRITKRISSHNSVRGQIFAPVALSNFRCDIRYRNNFWRYLRLNNVSYQVRHL
jgi:hypothetical protein